MELPLNINMCKALLPDYMTIHDHSVQSDPVKAFEDLEPHQSKMSLIVPISRYVFQECRLDSQRWMGGKGKGVEQQRDA